jgi:hypothetical protein
MLNRQTPPRPWLACSRCGGVRPFQSSGKSRLNANGKRLDAWLIYRCVACDSTWNRPLFERRNVRELARETLAALETSAPDLVRRWAFDVNDLKRRVGRVEESDDIHVEKLVVGEQAKQRWSLIEIEMQTASAAGIRLDRLLSTELDLSRGRVERLADEGRLLIRPSHRNALRRPVADGTLVTIAIAGLDDGVAIAVAALGRAVL